LVALFEQSKCYKFSNNGLSVESVFLPQEIALTLNINGQSRFSILCTPSKLEYLITGFLYSEKIVSSVADIENINIDYQNFTAHITTKTNIEIKDKKTITSGFGSGFIFNYDGEIVSSQLTISPDEIISVVELLYSNMELYKISGGVHASALSDGKKIIIISEDIGRHNSIDKIHGESLSIGLDTKDMILITTGRISSEMLLKSSRMKIPIVISKKSITANSFLLADRLGITIIANVKGNTFNIYTHPERVLSKVG